MTDPTSTATTAAPAAKTDAGPAGADPRSRKAQPLWLRVLRTRAAAIFALDAVLFIVFTAASGGLFGSLPGVQSLLLSGTEALLLAVGLSLLLGAGIFDLSLGGNLVLSSVVGAVVMTRITGPDPASAASGTVATAMVVGGVACIVTGMLFGLVNGLLVAYARINALIATLGTLGVGTGLAYVISGGGDVAGLPTQLQGGFGLATLGSIPVPTIIAIVITGVVFVIVAFTRFGVRTLAIGSSRIAAERTGIRVPSHLLRLTIVAGALAGVAGLVNIAHFGGTSLNGHANDALNAVTAAVIGGTVLEGGKISIPGAIWGTALAVILQGGLVIIGVSAYYQLMAVGVVLIVAVGLDRISYRRRRQAS